MIGPRARNRECGTFATACKRKYKVAASRNEAGRRIKATTPPLKKTGERSDNREQDAILDGSRFERPRQPDKPTMADQSSEAEKAAIQAELERLRLEHGDLQAAIEALLAVGSVDQLQIQRLKKRKLALRDRLQRLEDDLTPDIIA